VAKAAGQPSEADLFYMLINKLKRRDEAEAAAMALNEQMKEELCKADQEKKTLAAQLDQAVARSRTQDSEITSQRDLIDRWKAKFARLRAIVGLCGPCKAR
jgi:transcriptional antiterminator Rof (Rho-off)